MEMAVLRVVTVTCSVVSIISATGTTVRGVGVGATRLRFGDSGHAPVWVEKAQMGLPSSERVLLSGEEGHRGWEIHEV